MVRLLFYRFKFNIKSVILAVKLREILLCIHRGLLRRVALRQESIVVIHGRVWLNHWGWCSSLCIGLCLDRLLVWIRLSNRHGHLLLHHWLLHRNLSKLLHFRLLCTTSHDKGKSPENEHSNSIDSKHQWACEEILFLTLNNNGFDVDVSQWIVDVCICSIVNRPVGIRV